VNGRAARRRADSTQRRELLWVAFGFGVLLGLLLLGSFAADKAGGAPVAPRSEQERQLDLDSFDHAWALVRDRHYDPALGGLDWQAVRDSLRPRVGQAASRRAARAVMASMVSLLGQSHFEIIPGEVLTALARTPGEGVPGGTLGMDARVVGGRALVTAVEPGSPAHVLGVRPGWEIERVGEEELAPLIRTVAGERRDVSWKEADLASVVLGRIEGRIGDTLAVRFRDGRGAAVDHEFRLVEKKGWLCDFGVVRNLRVRFESRWLAGNVGYVAFSAFLDPVHLMPAYEAAIRSFAGADGIVLDLRGNAGGMLPLAMGMAGWLVSEKDVYLGTLSFRGAQLRAVVNPRLEPYTGPVAVLVDGLTMSCAEAFAGGLQDIGRARVFGTRTAGMVLNSEIERLPNGDALQFVTASYRSAKGRRLEGQGVIPDIVAPPVRGALLRGRDPALDAAVKWIHGLKRSRGSGEAPAPSNATPAAAGR
jgi:carboxyl-terminal processing protease